MFERHNNAYNRKVVVLLLLLVFLPFLTNCGQVSILDYTIPDDYEGFLVVQYSCPAQPLIQQKGRFQITFQNNGTACLAASYSDVYPHGVSSIGQVRTRSGRQVPHVPIVDEATGYGFVDIAVMTNREGSSTTTSEDTFSILWAGEVKHLAQMSQAGTYSTNLSQFLEANFGIPRNP